MDFKKEDLLTLQDFKNLMVFDVNDRADIITNNLINYVFYLHGTLYKFNSKYVVYKKIEIDEDDELLTIVTKFISVSKKNLINQDNQELYDPKFKSFGENVNINKMLPQIRTGLKKEENIFTPDFYQIHYRNGFINLKTLKFENRIIGKHFVRAYINRDYKPSSKEQQETILNRIKKIYPVKEDLESILYILGSAMTGKATKEQKILFLLGLGESGKSTILLLTQKAIDCYFQQLEEDAFSNSNSNKDKTFSTFSDTPHVRIIWTNEPKEDGMNVSIFKMFVEGVIKGKLLYKNGIHQFEHNGLPVFTANQLPNIKMDSGVKRRFRGCNHLSKFVSDPKLVNESKNIYLKDRDFLDNIVQDELLDAWIDILAQYANKWIKGEIIPLSKNFQESTEEMINVNDIYQDFIDSKLKITTDETNRIGKNIMLGLFKEMYPNRGSCVQTLISKLGERKIEYNSQIRCKDDNTRGCFKCVVIRDFDDSEEVKPPEEVKPVIEIKTPIIDIDSDSDKDEILINPKKVKKSVSKPKPKKHAADEDDEDLEAEFLKLAKSEILNLL
jgi:phage/plasmid-associated DNA primase